VAGQRVLCLEGGPRAGATSSLDASLKLLVHCCEGGDVEALQVLPAPSLAVCKRT